jgi:aminocarboxymuconate-semialdehyde decarboxylase
MTVDIHTHFMPLDLPDPGGGGNWPMLDAGGGDPQGRIMRGGDVFRVVARTTWDVDARVAAMDSSGAEIHVISPVPVTLVYSADSAPAARYIRSQNDLIAEAVAKSGGRLMGMGGVPLQDVDLAIAELDHVVGDLGLAAIEIGTCVGDRELDDASLRPFFAAVEERGVPLFIHPTDGKGAIRRSGQPYEFGIGMLTDTAMAVAGLLFGGVLDQLPSLRIGLAHGCGTFPWAYPRITRMAGAIGSRGDALGTVDELVRTLWVDSLVFDPTHMPLLLSRFGADHVMLGSDFPFLSPAFGRPEDVVTEAVTAGACTAAEGNSILQQNALRFLSVGDQPG